jgi:pimeloyl-ACP methyl ester carboxylesterase
MTTPKPALVLVHGAWGGAWVWKRVLAPLRAAGYEVHTVTLTGDGDRAHLRRPDIDLDDHIQDVVGLVEMEELSRVIIVGHSYGGMVITGAAAALEAKHPGMVAGLIYVDAMVPIPGEGWGGGHSEEVAAARFALAAANDNALPAPDAREGFNVSDEDAAWLNRRHVPHPFGMYRVPLNFDGDVINALPRLFINCTNPPYPTIDVIRERVYSTPGWKIDELDSGHFPMVSEPQALVNSILNFSNAL